MLSQGQMKNVNILETVCRTDMGPSPFVLGDPSCIQQGQGQMFYLKVK